MLSICFTPKAFKEMQSLNEGVRNRIGKKLEFIFSTENPFYFAKKLTGADDNFFRFKIGSHRVIFYATKDEITIVRVGHRSSIYKKFP